MDAILNINANAAAFSDQALTNNPRRKYFDWTRNVNGVKIKNPKASSHLLAPGETRSIFNGSRTTTIGFNTAFDVTMLDATTYRFEWSGGTAPGLRTQRAVAITNTQVTMTVNNNSTVVMQAGGIVPVFGNIATGDCVYIFSPSDGATPFNPANAGNWIVLSAAAQKLILARPVTEAFNGVTETVTVNNTSSGPILAYSASGVQAGDMVEIMGGFQAPTQKSYKIIGATSNWFDVSSVSPLPEETNVVPGMGSIMFYSQAKLFVRCEVDQDAELVINGGSPGIRVSPLVAADQSGIGWFENFGSVWSLSITNRTPYELNASVFSAE